MPSKRETGSRGTNSCLPFAIDALLNLSVTKEVALKAFQWNISNVKILLCINIWKCLCNLIKANCVWATQARIICQYHVLKQGHLAHLPLPVFLLRVANRLRWVKSLDKKWSFEWNIMTLNIKVRMDTSLFA